MKVQFRFQIVVNYLPTAKFPHLLDRIDIPPVCTCSMSNLWLESKSDIMVGAKLRLRTPYLSTASIPVSR